VDRAKSGAIQIHLCRAQWNITVMDILGIKRPSYQRSHPDTARFDDGKMACPIVSRRNQIGKTTTNITRPGHRKTKEHDTTSRMQSRVSGKFTEVFIECEQYPSLARRPNQHIRVAHPGARPS
jgi:hypothetical protein